MKKSIYLLLVAIPAVLLLASINRFSSTPTGFKMGTPAIKSMNTLAFGPGGILFIADSRGATIFAIDTKDVQAIEKAQPVEIKNIDQKIAAFLGTETKNLK